MPDDDRIGIRVTASRLSKGLLAVPQEHVHLFPKEKQEIRVRLEDGNRLTALTYSPFGDRTKEARIFGLGTWFKNARIHEGALLWIIREGVDQYRIVSDRALKLETENAARAHLTEAPSEAEADNDLQVLSRLTRKPRQVLVREEVERIAKATKCTPRPRLRIPHALRSEGVPAGLRILLRELHNGKCQLCSFTFQKQDGYPYFEIHHIDPACGHHPYNLLLVCGNCHAQLEHAFVTDHIWQSKWLVRVTINGKKIAIRQPLLTNIDRRAILGIGMLFLLGKVGLLLTKALGQELEA
jgi:hypothetical protein